LVQKYKIQRHLIIKLLKNAKIAIRPNNIECQTLNINETYFDVIDSERKAYFLGLMYADGCVTKIGQVAISLVETDREILEEFIKDLCPSYNLREFKPKNGNACVRFSFRRKRLAESLIRAGCIPNKSYKLKKLPNINDNLMFHFLRGYFDGDGCVYFHSQTKNPNISVVGTKPFIKKIILFLQKFDMKCGLYKTGSKTTFEMKMGAKKSVDKFYNKIYDESSVFLKRKKEKFKSI